MATIRRKPSEFFGSGSGSANTASSKSRASAPSMVIKGVVRKSSRPASGALAERSASAIASFEKVIGISASAMAKRLTDFAPPSPPNRSMTVAEDLPYVLPALILARTTSPASASDVSPRATIRSDFAFRSAGIMRPPSEEPSKIPTISRAR